MYERRTTAFVIEMNIFVDFIFVNYDEPLIGINSKVLYFEFMCDSPALTHPYNSNKHILPALSISLKIIYIDYFRILRKDSSKISAQWMYCSKNAGLNLLSINQIVLN